MVRTARRRHGTRTRGGRALAGSTVAALLVACATAGLAGIRMHVFSDAAPLADAELDDLRGGFTLPKMPDVTVRFGFTFDAVADLPSPAFVAVAEGRTRTRSTSTVAFDDPRQASVSTRRTVNGRVVRDAERVVDLTRERIELQVGDPERAAITHVLDADQVTTLVRSVIADAQLRTDDTIAITLSGVPALQRKLPSLGLVRSMETLRHALTTMSR